MSATELIWGAPTWVYGTTAGLAAIGFLVLFLSWRRITSRPRILGSAIALRTIAYLTLLGCLLEPSCSSLQPETGANVFLVVADNSQSLQVRDAGSTSDRADRVRALLDTEQPWLETLDQDFDLRRFQFDTRLKAVSDFSELTFQGVASSLGSALQTISTRYRDRPLAGILLLTDGNATDATRVATATADLAPIYPVVIGREAPARDISVSRVAVSQTNFEAAPVTVTAEIEAHGYDDEDVVVQLLDENGNVVSEQVQSPPADARQQGEPRLTRFQLQPETGGISFYQVRANAATEVPDANDDENASGEEPAPAATVEEATQKNNQRLAIVDRGGGPFRILYISGRPNWEFKFLRRASREETDVQLVGLIRIAKREPKFEFRSRRGESTNPLFRGFGNDRDETVEQYDEPVLLRLGTRDADELRGGFPKSAEDLFAYHAVILDDLEASFFTQDQMLLLQSFVSERGGGFLMLGGYDSFVEGNYRRTPIGEFLPVYLTGQPASAADQRFRLALTREGWLQPWVRVRDNEPDERVRLAEMPDFETVNRVQGIKPGAAVLATVTQQDGKSRPALVTQRFGKGRVSALLIGDMWRWAMERKEPSKESDLEKAWRQMLRWLVADVGQRIELETRKMTEDPHQGVELTVRVRDEKFLPLDNASVQVRVTDPDGNPLLLTAAASDEQAGVYRATHVPRKPGAYRAQVTVNASDQRRVGEREVGWTAEPAPDELRSLTPNRRLLEDLAAQTGGEMVRAEDLRTFSQSLQRREAPIQRRHIDPLWNHWIVLAVSIICLTGEWSLRRWSGLR